MVCVTTLSWKRGEKEASILKFVSEGGNDGTKNRKREIIQKKSIFREKINVILRCWLLGEKNRDVG